MTPASSVQVPRFSSVPAPSPEPGADTEEALAAWGLEAAEIAALRAEVAALKEQAPKKAAKKD